MPPQPDSALPTRLSSITARSGSNLLGRKLRIAGRTLSYDPQTGCILLSDRNDVLVVDVSICIEPFKRQGWLRESKSAIMIIGYLERLTTRVPPFQLPSHIPIPISDIDASLILRAVLVMEPPELDMNLWNTAIAKMEESSSGFSGS